MDVLDLIATQLSASGIASDVIARVTNAMREEMGGQQHYVRGHDYQARDAQIRTEYQRLKSYSRVAARFGLSERRVREIVG